MARPAGMFSQYSLSYLRAPSCATTLQGDSSYCGFAALRVLEPQADLAALRNLRRDTIAQEYSWVIDLLCKPGAPPGKREACAAAEAQWRSYEAEQAAAGGGWAAHASVIEASLCI